MNQAQVVKRYLQNPKDVDFRDTGYPLIAISRQAGTGSHAVGRYVIMRLAESEDPDLRTGWDLYDQKLFALIAQNKSLDADYDMLLEDKYRGGGLRRMVYELLIGHAQEYRIQKKIDEVLMLLARLGKVVIIGRGGFHLLRNMPGAIRLRLVAPLEYRIENYAKHTHLPQAAAAKAIKAIDRERECYIRSHYQRDIHDPLNYDLVWNMANGEMSDLVNVMADLVRVRLERLRKAGAIAAHLKDS